MTNYMQEVMFIDGFLSAMIQMSDRADVYEHQDSLVDIAFTLLSSRLSKEYTQEDRDAIQVAFNEYAQGQRDVRHIKGTKTFN